LVQQTDLGPPETERRGELAQHPGADLLRPSLRRAEQGETVEGAHLLQAADATRRQKPPRARGPVGRFGTGGCLLHRRLSMSLNVEHARLILVTRVARVNRIHARGALRANSRAMRAAALPSQSGIGLGRGAGARRIRRAAATILSVSAPTRTFVPRDSVIGRSVFSRRVRQGTPRMEASSWIPPESVKTRRA